MGYVQVPNVTYMLHLLHAGLDHGPWTPKKNVSLKSPELISRRVWALVDFCVCLEAVQLRHTSTVASIHVIYWIQIVQTKQITQTWDTAESGMDDSSDGLAEFLEGTKHEWTFCRSSARLLRTGVFSVTSKSRTIWADASSFSFRFFQQCPPSRKAAAVVVHRRRMLRRR